MREHLNENFQYGDVGRVAVGAWGARLVDIALVFTQYGFCAAYLIFLGNTIHDLGANIDLEVRVHHGDRLALFPTPVRAPLTVRPASSQYTILLMVPVLLVCAMVRNVRGFGCAMQSERLCVRFAHAPCQCS